MNEILKSAGNIYKYEPIIDCLQNGIPDETKIRYFKTISFQRDEYKALTTAINKSPYEIIKALIEFGADVNLKSRKNYI